MDFPPEYAIRILLWSVKFISDPMNISVTLFSDLQYMLSRGCFSKTYNSLPTIGFEFIVQCPLLFDRLPAMFDAMMRIRQSIQIATVDLKF